MLTPTRIRWLLMAGATLVVTMALAQGTSTGARAADAAVTIKDFAFEPGSITVSAGSVVTWTNTAGQAHTVTSDDGTSFDSQSIAAGGAFGNLFDTPGRYAYHCAIHPQMTGVVIVTAAAATPAASGSPEPTPPPGTLPPSFQPNPTGPTPAATAATGGSLPSTPARDQTQGLDAGLIIGVGLVVLIAVAAAAYVLARRR